VSPPGKETGPPRSEPVPEVAALDDDTSKGTMDSEFPATAAINPAPCRIDWSKVIRRRRAQRELSVLLAEMYPPKPWTPSTYGLEPSELRAEARRLYATGWNVQEIRDTLELEPVTS
jgi:hypothetical protein